jgi:hypothetical protein
LHSTGGVARLTTPYEWRFLPAVRGTLPEPSSASLNILVTPASFNPPYGFDVVQKHHRRQNVSDGVAYLSLDHILL